MPQNPLTPDKSPNEIAKPMLKIAKGVKVSPKGATVYCATIMPLQDPTSVIALPPVPP